MNKDATLHQLKTVTSQLDIFMNKIYNLSMTYDEIRQTDQINSKKQVLLLQK